MIGELNKRLTLQKRNDTADTAGGFARGWTDVRKIWASVTPGAGSETFITDQRQHVTTHRVVCRYATDIGPDNRFLYKGRTLDIDSIINEDEDDRFLVLSCLEKHGD